MYIMTTFHKTNTRALFTIEGRPDVDITRVFSREYFDRLGLAEFHVSIKRPGIATKNIGDEQLANETVQDLENEERDLSEQFLGRERFPNGYTQLPLKIKPSPQIGGSILNTIYDYTKKYTEYFTTTSASSKVGPQLPEQIESMTIAFPPHNIKTYKAWRDEHVSNESSLFSFPGTTISYELLERIITDLYLQIEYLHDYGYTLSTISTDFVYVIQDRFVLLDGTAIERLDTKNVRDTLASTAVLQFIFDIFGKKQGDVLVDFSEIRNTRVYYILKRLQDDFVFVMV